MNRFKCRDCGIESHDDEDWREDSDGDLVCRECAKVLPEYSTTYHNRYSQFYGTLTRKVSDGNHEFHETPGVKTENEARVILAKWSQLLYNCKPIEELD